MILVVVLIFGFDLYSVLLPFSTFLVAFAFAFGNSLKIVWESAIFIFGIHPYDVGDRIQIESDPQINVSRINLLTTEGYTTDGRLYIYFHSYIATTTIGQFERSRDYTFNFTLHFSNDTTEEQLKEMGSRLYTFLSTDTSFPWKFETWNWGISGVTLQNILAVWFWLELQDINWGMSGKWYAAQTSLLLKIKSICQDLNIVYYPPTQEILVSKEGKKEGKKEL